MRLLAVVHRLTQGDLKSRKKTLNTGKQWGNFIRKNRKTHIYTKVDLPTRNLTKTKDSDSARHLDDDQTQGLRFIFQHGLQASNQSSWYLALLDLLTREIQAANEGSEPLRTMGDSESIGNLIPVFIPNHQVFIPKNPCSSHVHPTSHSPLFPPTFPPRVHRSPSSPGSAVRGQCRPSPPPAHRPQIQVDPLGSQKAIRTGWKWEVHSFFEIQCFWNDFLGGKSNVFGRFWKKNVDQCWNRFGTRFLCRNIGNLIVEKMWSHPDHIKYPLGNRSNTKLGSIWGVFHSQLILGGNGFLTQHMKKNNNMKWYETSSWPLPLPGYTISSLLFAGWLDLPCLWVQLGVAQAHIETVPGRLLGGFNQPEKHVWF